MPARSTQEWYLLRLKRAEVIPFKPRLQNIHLAMLSISVEENCTSR